MSHIHTRLKFAVSGFTLCLLELSTTSFAYAVIPQQEYDLVIRAAHDGQTATAIEQLQAWHNTYPENQKILYDLVVILGWAGDFNGALAFADQLRTPQTPAYVLKSLGQSARSAKRWSDAESAYELALRKAPDDIEARTGLLHAMLGLGKKDEALHYVQSFLPKFSSSYQTKDVPMIILLGFVHARRDEHLLAANAYQEALRLAPQSREAFRAYVFALSAGDMPYLAARTADRRLTLFSVEEQSQIAHSTAGRTVKYGEVQASIDEKQPRFLTTDNALNNIDNVITRFGNRPATAFDHMVALRDRQMMKEVVQLYKELSAAGIVMPAYAKAAAADAYLYLEQPEISRDLYTAAIKDISAGDVADVGAWRIGLAYAYNEAEQHDEAQATADQVLLVTPTLANRGIVSVEAPNADYPTATVTAALMRMYADRLNEAEKRLAELRAIAPFNGQTRLAWASLQSAREHPRASLEEFTLMQLDDPKSLDAQLGRGTTLFALQEFTEAQKILPPLVTDYPQDKGVQLFTRKLDIHDRPFLKISTTFGKGGEIAGAESIFDAQLYSRPLTNSLGEPYRVFTHLSRSSGHIDAGQVDEENIPRTRIGVGVDYRIRDLTIEAEINRAIENAESSGIALQLNKDFSDTWSMRVAADSNVNDLSSVAYNNDVTAKRLSVGARWQKNESRSIDAELSNTQFSDDNRRDAFGVGWTERWISGPVFKLDSGLSFATSRNSASNVAYFNPVSDKEVTLALIGEWRTWRRYRRSMTQQVEVFVGRYWQQDFNAGPTSGARYGHEWAIDDAFTLGYGIGISTHPYDGVRERRNYGYLTLNWAIK